MIFVFFSGFTIVKSIKSYYQLLDKHIAFPKIGYNFLCEVDEVMAINVILWMPWTPMEYFRHYANRDTGRPSSLTKTSMVTLTYGHEI